jgi:GNAT superfamily N-acetyltransferase
MWQPSSKRMAVAVPHTPCVSRSGARRSREPNRTGFVTSSWPGDGALVGFAKGVPYEGTIEGYSGELNKIYLLRKFHRLGLGRRLIGYVSRRFLANGINSMLLFGDAHNPSNGFYEALGATLLLSPEGEFHGGYGWRDLRALAKECPTEQG